MENRQIKIDDIEIDSRSGEEFTFEGLFSKTTLSGIILKLERVDHYNQKIIEDLLKEKEVDIYDPFVERNYKAEITQKSNSYMVGSEVKSYELEVKELDQIPNFEEIELNGICFNVLSYRESITSNTISRQGVLKLTKDEFEKFRDLLSEESLEVCRVGVDNQPFEMRLGSKMFWSEHYVNGTPYFKHIFRLFEKELEPNRLDFASGVIQLNAATMLVELTAKFEELLGVLKTDDSLSNDVKAKLESISNNKFSTKELMNSLYDNLERVNDADKHFE